MSHLTVFAFASSALLIAGAVAAQDRERPPPNQPSRDAPGAAGPTRAQVKADLHVWRLAGLDQFYRGEGSLRLDSPDYQEARARYERLRASARYVEIVRQIERGLQIRSGILAE